MVSPNLGKLGEELTAQWLKNQGWEILESRWRCRWGELDLVAYHSCFEEKMQSCLSFVEVKTRTSKNWDADGLLALTPQKQGKLYRSAEMFLSCYPEYSNVICCFDLALVKAKPDPRRVNRELLSLVELKTPVYYQGYELTLMTYLKGIF